MRRVPVMLDDPYFQRLLKDFPVLFIDKWEDLLTPNTAMIDSLYQQAQTMDMSKLDLKQIYDQCVKI